MNEENTPAGSKYDASVKANVMDSLIDRDAEKSREKDVSERIWQVFTPLPVATAAKNVEIAQDNVKEKVKTGDVLLVYERTIGRVIAYPAKKEQWRK